MASTPLPDTIDPQSPSEMPPIAPPLEEPSDQPDEIAPVEPDQSQPDSSPDEVPEIPGN